MESLAWTSSRLLKLVSIFDDDSAHIVARAFTCALFITSIKRLRFLGLRILQLPVSRAKIASPVVVRRSSLCYWQYPLSASNP